MWAWGYIVLWPISLESSACVYYNIMYTISFLLYHTFSTMITCQEPSIKANLFSLYIDHLRHPSTVKNNPS